MSSSFLSHAVSAARRLESAGVPGDEARHDAEVLARAALGWDVARWLAERHRPSTPAFDGAFGATVDRRAAREPVAYILGEREFYGRSFRVSAAVLVPRPETELVVERALHVLRETPEPAPKILDVGTGSGCLAITLALECPDARVVATDISTPALAVATANAVRHEVADRVEFRHGSLFAGADVADVIVSNPPYVAERDRASLPADVVDHEPAEALFGGPDGLAVIGALVPASAHALRPGGWLVMEIGAGQWPAVCDLVHAAGFAAARVVEDLAGIPRVVVAQAPGR